MTTLPAARPSPRVAGGVLRWYAGDTFKVTLRLELQDQDGEAVTVGADDSAGAHLLLYRRDGELRDAGV